MVFTVKGLQISVRPETRANNFLSKCNMSEEDNTVPKDIHAETQHAAVETATEAKEPPPPDISQLCAETFRKTAEYLEGELAGTADDYRLLETMNRTTVHKYVEMKQIAVNINKAMKDLDDKYRSLQPYLDQIDQIEESVATLEQAAYKLDAYSKRLEAKFKQLEKR